MATKTIAQLTAASAAAPSNLIEMDDGSGASWNLTLDQVRRGIVQNSGNITLNNTTMAYTYAHGLGRTPIYLRTVLVCLTADTNWGCSIGDEIDFDIFNTNSYLLPSFWLNSTNIIISLQQPLVGKEENWIATVKAGGSFLYPTSFNNFALKFYFF